MTQDLDTTFYANTTNDSSTAQLLSLCNNDNNDNSDSGVTQSDQDNGTASNTSLPSTPKDQSAVIFNVSFSHDNSDSDIVLANDNTDSGITQSDQDNSAVSNTSLPSTPKDQPVVVFNVSFSHNNSDSDIVLANDNTDNGVTQSDQDNGTASNTSLPTTPKDQSAVIIYVSFSHDEESTSC